MVSRMRTYRIFGPRECCMLCTGSHLLGCLVTGPVLYERWATFLSKSEGEDDSHSAITDP